MKKIILSCLLTLLFWTITNIAQAKLTEAIPIYAIGTLLKQLPLHDTAIVYEEKLRSMDFYVLPEGMNAATVLHGKMIQINHK